MTTEARSIDAGPISGIRIRGDGVDVANYVVVGLTVVLAAAATVALRRLGCL
jgi:hypothetical protein